MLVLMETMTATTRPHKQTQKGKKALQDFL
jgi:hypothetical protein